MIAVLSVESTGTHFVAAVLAKLLGAKAGWADSDDPPEIRMAHVYPPGFGTDNAAGLLAEASKAVIPLRDPVGALISNADRALRALPYPTHAAAFKRIAAWRSLPDVHFFRVDPKEQYRPQEVNKLAEFLGVEPVEVPWKPMNVTPPRFRTALRAFRREKDWDRLNLALDGALDVLCESREFFEWSGYEVDWC